MLRAAGVASPEVRWSGAVERGRRRRVLLIACSSLFRTLAGDDPLPRSSASLARLSPLFWFTALRPLSDLSGLAVAFGALAR